MPQLNGFKDLTRELHFSERNQKTHLPNPQGKWYSAATRRFRKFISVSDTETQSWRAVEGIFEGADKLRPNPNSFPLLWEIRVEGGPLMFQVIRC